VIIWPFSVKEIQDGFGRALAKLVTGAFEGKGSLTYLAASF
jgi:hypothetical protein